jgi:hypothetical protein
VFRSAAGDRRWPVIDVVRLPFTFGSQPEASIRSGSGT